MPTPSDPLANATPQAGVTSPAPTPPAPVPSASGSAAPEAGVTSSGDTPQVIGALKAAAVHLAEASMLDQFDQIQAAELAARPDAYVDTSTLISPHRVYVRYLPCRHGEPCGVMAPTGYDAARAADGLHLCPSQLKTVNGVVTECSVYSTSAVRFAEQVAAVS